MISFFPEEAPKNPTPHAAAMKVKHLLSMGTGHKADFMETAHTRADGDWVRNFFEHLPEAEPGSLFVYNNMATYMCSAIVTKLTGMSAHDYLMPRLFTPLGLGDPYWTSCPKGEFRRCIWSASDYGADCTLRSVPPSKGEMGRHSAAAFGMDRGGHVHPDQISRIRRQAG